MDLEKLTEKTGWCLENLCCPKCGSSILAKRNPENGFSQFICINMECAFVDNLKEQEVLSESVSDYMLKQAKLILFMFKIGFTREEVVTAINALRIEKDLKMVNESMNKKE